MAAVRPGAAAVVVVPSTSQASLAGREHRAYARVLGPLGFAVHRVDPAVPAPAPVPGQPAVYVATTSDLAFHRLRHGQAPGRGRLIALHDEVDQMAVYDGTAAGHSYVLSRGQARKAPRKVSQAVEEARDDLAGLLDQGERTGGAQGLTPAHFGAGPGSEGARAALTRQGRERAGFLSPAARAALDSLEDRGLLAGLDAPGTAAALAAAGVRGAAAQARRLHRLQMAAEARFNYKDGQHYLAHGGMIHIINQFTHAVMSDPETGTASRWFGGLAQALEAKHRLTVRADADPAATEPLTNQQLFAGGAFTQVSGMSGTALGHEAQYAAHGISAKVTAVPRYFRHQLQVSVVTARDQDAKRALLAADAAAALAGGRPQLIIATGGNHEVAEYAAALHAAGVPPPPSTPSTPAGSSTTARTGRPRSPPSPPAPASPAGSP
jgi:hypothetical protein